jgi:hypothetical protein
MRNEKKMWQIIKENDLGEETWRYEGALIAMNAEAVLLDARFNRDDFMFNGIPFCRGDRFIEAYYRTRWFNIFEIYQGETDQLKGWYCNVTYPAEIREGLIRYRDLALDVLIFPDQHSLILDEEEFEALQLPAEIKQKARKIPEELLLLFSEANGRSICDWFTQV